MGKVSRKERKKKWQHSIQSFQSFQQWSPINERFQKTSGRTCTALTVIWEAFAKQTFSGFIDKMQRMRYDVIFWYGKMKHLQSCCCRKLINGVLVNVPNLKRNIFLQQHNTKRLIPSSCDLQCVIYLQKTWRAFWPFIVAFNGLLWNVHDTIIIIIYIIAAITSCCLSSLDFFFSVLIRQINL